MTTATTSDQGFLSSGFSPGNVGTATHHWMPNPDWRWWAFWRQRELLWTLPRSTVIGGSGAEAKRTLQAD